MARYPFITESWVCFKDIQNASSNVKSSNAWLIKNDKAVHWDQDKKMR